VAFVPEYRAPSAARLEQYLRDHAPALQRAHTSRYAGWFEASRAVRTIVAEVTASLA
jgi:hypothetical protein